MLSRESFSWDTDYAANNPELNRAIIAEAESISDQALECLIHNLAENMAKVDLDQLDQMLRDI